MFLLIIQHPRLALRTPGDQKHGCFYVNTPAKAHNCWTNSPFRRNAGTAGCFPSLVHASGRGQLAQRGLLLDRLSTCSNSGSWIFVWRDGISHRPFPPCSSDNNGCCLGGYSHVRSIGQFPLAAQKVGPTLRSSHTPTFAAPTNFPAASRLCPLIPLRNYASIVTDSPSPLSQPGRNRPPLRAAPCLPQALPQRLPLPPEFFKSR